MKHKFLFILLFSLVLEGMVTTQAVAGDYVHQVNTLIGTKGTGLTSGYLYPGATYPYGMVQFTPSYFSKRSGFVINQLSGGGCEHMGNFPTFPVKGKLKMSPDNILNYRINVSEEKGHAGYYEAMVQEDIKAKLTVTERTGMASYEYPADQQYGTIIIGGGMAYTFLKAQGLEVGKSLVDDEKIDYCKEMMAKAEKLGKNLYLPIDTTVADGFPNPIDAEIEVSVVAADAIPADKEGLDIGPATCEKFAEAVKTAKTVVWNGPMGVFENPILAKGTIAVAQALADTDATTIIGGGDSAAAVNQLGFADKMTHISTGGGASLEFLEGKDLPGVVAANDK